MTSVRSFSIVRYGERAFKGQQTCPDGSNQLTILQRHKQATSSNLIPIAQRPDTRKPTAVFKSSKPRSHTVSLALPGSIIGNAQTHDFKTTLASNIARALAVFCIDEVVVYNDGTSSSHRSINGNTVDHGAADAASGYTAYSDPDHFLAHVLSYLETPPHMRRRLFPYHPNLRSAGSMPSLDMPHHLRSDEWCRWRDGVVLGHANGVALAEKEHNSKKRKRGDEESRVDAGLGATVRVQGDIPENTRVTLDLGETEPDSNVKELAASAVHPAAPREEEGYYWGYSVRRADSLSAVLTECAFDGGYDFCIGTSERGEPIQNFLDRGLRDEQSQWQHLLMVFGGVAGLEVALGNDRELTRTVEDPDDLFDAYLNLVPNQGSRTIRTEEAIWLGCMGLRPLIASRDEC